MNAAVGWALAVAAVAAGYVSYGWPGVLLALSVVVFWLLLQFSRAMRLMRQAAQKPIGSVTSALMLQTRLRQGMLLNNVLKLTGSFGSRAAAEAADEKPADKEVYTWADAGGDALQVTLFDGKVTAWELQRAPAAVPLAAQLSVPSAEPGP